jgi:hypothetical protein
MTVTLRLMLIALSMMFLCASCVVPLPSRAAKSIISERVALGGAPAEFIEQEVVFRRRFYPFTPDGPFVTRQSVARFNYTLVNTNGSRIDLKFLTKKTAQTDYCVGFPLSDGRWIGITTPETNRPQWPAPADLEVFVFKKSNVLFSQTIAASLRTDEYPPEPWPGGPAWKPLTGGDYNSRNVRFQAANGQVIFRTASGDFLFNPNDGTLRTVQ